MERVMQQGEPVQGAFRDGTDAVGRTLYPEIAAGGFSRYDHRIMFYSRVNALLEPSMDVLDFGAGRGRFAEMESGYKARLTNLRGKCRKLTGFDVDPAVMQNPQIDEAVVGKVGEKLPFADASFDLIVSFAVLEHIAQPELYAGELARVLRPGGWLCAWTPNKWGYFALAARIIPERLHGWVLRGATPHRKEEDIFPTVYRMNSIGELRRLFPVGRFTHYTYGYYGPAGYHFNRVAIGRMWQLWARLVPPAMAQALHVFIRKDRPM